MSVAVLTLLMAAVFQFVDATQQRHRSNQLVAEINQGGRNVLELIAQEILQAGHNPNFSPGTTLTAGVNPSPTAQAATVASNQGMLLGNDVLVDPGGSPERVRIAALSGTQTFSGVFTSAHAATTPVVSAAQPFPTGIFVPPPALPMLIQFYGSLKGSGTLHYIEYSCFPPASNRTNPCPTTGTTSIAGTTYNLYALYRSYTLVNFTNPQTANAGSPMVDNVVATAAGVGPTGASVFALQTQTLGSNTVVTRVTVTLTLQALVRDPESGQFRTVTLRTQIIPRNILNAISVFNANTNDPAILPATPTGLPMTAQ